VAQVGEPVAPRRAGSLVGSRGNPGSQDGFLRAARVAEASSNGGDQPPESASLRLRLARRLVFLRWRSVTGVGERLPNRLAGPRMIQTAAPLGLGILLKYSVGPLWEPPRRAERHDARRLQGASYRAAYGHPGVRSPTEAPSLSTSIGRRR
jgi:hypothetical protein